MPCRPFIHHACLSTVIVLLGLSQSQSQKLRAQESSLFQSLPSQRSGYAAPVSSLPAPLTIARETGPQQPGVDLSRASWTYTPPLPARSFRLQDIVTIRVDELARARADGTAQVRKNTLYDAVLKDWIGFRDGDLGTDEQDTGDPRVNGQTNQLYRASSSLESRETMAFSVAARVVDIQPNGNLVLEATKTIWLNDNRWETSLSGICRAQDIAPDNVLLSRDLVDLQIRKNETGHVRDGYKRGWLTRWIDELNPF